MKETVEIIINSSDLLPINEGITVNIPHLFQFNSAIRPEEYLKVLTELNKRGKKFQDIETYKYTMGMRTPFARFEGYVVSGEVAQDCYKIDITFAKKKQK